MTTLPKYLCVENTVIPKHAKYDRIFIEMLCFNTMYVVCTGTFTVPLAAIYMCPQEKLIDPLCQSFYALHEALFELQILDKNLILCCFCNTF